MPADLVKRISKPVPKWVKEAGPVRMGRKRLSEAIRDLQPRRQG